MITTNRRAKIRLVVAGQAMVLASIGGLWVTTASSASTPAPPTAPASEGITVGGAGDVKVDRMIYEPGHSSGWHAHSGIHAVDILSGTLTVFDERCIPRTYGPGDPYVGGRSRHLARNDTPGVVEMSVTYLIPTGTSITEFVVPATAPPGCAAR